MSLTGTWHIYEMDLWDEDYCNMERQAYIKISASGSSEFHFGVVHGYLQSETEDSGGDHIDFDWEGNDEMDAASGSGWLERVSKDEVEGEISFFASNTSGFRARRAPKISKPAKKSKSGSTKKRKATK